MGANVGATRANDLPRRADDYGHAADNLASSRTDPNDAERDTGNYGSQGRASLRRERQLLTVPRLRRLGRSGRCGRGRFGGQAGPLGSSRTASAAGRETIQRPNTATPRAPSGRARLLQITDLLQRPP